MRKVARLDRILLDLGFVTEAQVEKAVARQGQLGLRFGMTLVELGFIDEDQLLTALAEQFRLPVLVPAEDELSPELAARMPPGVLEQGAAIPLSWNQVQGVLSVAVANPGDAGLMAKLKEAFDARGVRVAVAPERLLRALGQRLHGSETKAAATEPRRGGVVLPELFGWDSDSEDAGAEQAPPPTTPSRSALLVTGSAAKRNFLPPLLKTESWNVRTASGPDEIREALAEEAWDAVMVSEEIDAAFSEWIARGLVPVPSCEVLRLGGVGEALFGNPVPYDATMACLQKAVHALADARCAAMGTSAPYGLVARDLQLLGTAAGISRVVRDALDVAAHLLLPGDADPFDDFVASLELAAHLRFPWRLDSLLAACHDLCTGRIAAGSLPEGARGDESHRAAQILALVWFRHNYLAARAEDVEPEVALRAGLRKVADRLATSELVELYLRVLADRAGDVDETATGSVVLVGGERIRRSLVPALKRIGFEPEHVSDLSRAQELAERGEASALIVDFAAFPDRVHQFARVTKLGGRVLLFVLADAEDPSLVLNLLDAGVDDVFVASQDYGLVAARVNRALRSRRRAVGDHREESAGFSASFEVFSFLDLIQMLGHGRKSVRIELRNGDATATVFMRDGNLVHAVLGEAAGEAAVYGIIAWEDRGDFSVHQAEVFPEATIAASTESVLMEGCRLLDEAKRDALV